MIGETLLHLHRVSSLDFAQLPPAAPKGFGVAQFYATTLNALLNDSRKIHVGILGARFLWIDGREERVSIPNNGHSAAELVAHAMRTDDRLRALFKNGESDIIVLPSDPNDGEIYQLDLLFNDPQPLTWQDLFHAGRELERIFASHNKFYFREREQLLERLAALAQSRVSP